MKLLFSVVKNNKDEKSQREFRTLYHLTNKQSKGVEVSNKPLSKREELNKSFANPIFVFDLREHKIVLDKLTHKYASN